MIMRSAEPLDGQAVENMLGSARKNAEPQNCCRGGREPCLHGFYCRIVFRRDEVVECTVLIELHFTAREVLNHRDLDTTLTKLKAQEQSQRAELTRRIAELKKKVDTAEKTSLTLEEAAKGNGQNLKRETEKRGRSSMSEGSPNARCSPKAKGLTRRYER